MYEVGLGIDIYLSFFKFSPSIRGLFAMNRELVDDNNNESPWTSPKEIKQSTDNAQCSTDMDDSHRYESSSENQLPYQTVNRKKRSRTPSLLKKYKH